MLRFNRITSPKLGIWLEKVSALTHTPTIGVAGGFYTTRTHWNLNIGLWNRQCLLKIEARNK